MSEAKASPEAKAVQVRETGGTASWPPFAVRIPPYMREALAERANQNSRSLNAEVMRILASALGVDVPQRVRFRSKPQVTRPVEFSDAS